MKKPVWFIYINNTLAFLIYKVLSVFFKSYNAGSSRGVLLINTGHIGDLVVSSIIMENDHLFQDQESIYFIMREEYTDLFKHYSGKVKIIKWNYRSYKWSLFYRIRFLKSIHRLNLKFCFNLTSARGITCDEVALLSGAESVYCLNSNWMYLKKAFVKFMDKEYKGVMFSDTFNEYEKHHKVLAFLTGKKSERKPEKLFNTDIMTLTDKLTCHIKSGYITVAPLASDKDRGYGISNYRKLCIELAKNYPVFLLGSANERDLISGICENQENIFNLAGKTDLTSIPAIIKNSVLYIGNDSGLTHIALSLGVKMIGIIGGGNYGKYLPYNEKETVVYKYKNLDCFGCEWNCSYPSRICLTEIPLDEILNDINKILCN